MDATIRRLQNNLITLGTGTIAFGIWTLIKFTLICTLLRSDYLEASGFSSYENFDLVFIITVMFTAIVDFTLRCIIGFSARSEGKGKKKGWFYLITAAIIVLLYIASVFAEVSAIIRSEQDIPSQIITIIIDSTSTLLIIEIIVSSIRLKKLLKQRGGTHE